MGRQRCCICHKPGIKLHEIPSDRTMREKWLAVIPNSDQLGENPKVCEKHFHPSDYNQETKRNLLKRNVVPMVFKEGEIIDLDPSLEVQEKDRYLVFFSKNIEEKSSELHQANSKLLEVESKLKQLTKGKGDVQIQIQTVEQQIESLKEENKIKTCRVQVLSNELKKLQTFSHKQEALLKQRDKTVEDLKRKTKQFEVLAKKRKIETIRLKEKTAKEKEDNLRKIQNLKGQVEILTSDRKELEQNCYYKNIEEMILNMDTDRKAAFILDQIKLYNMKAPRYSETTLQECVIWEDTDPRGYQFVKDSELLTLPGQITLKKHLGPIGEESMDVTSKGKPVHPQEIGEVGDETNEAVASLCELNSGLVLASAQGS